MGRRGFWASWPQAGAPGGNLLATAVLALLAWLQSEAAFLSWGWRIPFLLSGVLVVIGLWIRVSIAESPVFLAAQAAGETRAAAGELRRAPIRDAFRDHPTEILVAMGARMAENVCYYVITAFAAARVRGVVADLDLRRHHGADHGRGGALRARDQGPRPCGETGAS